MRASLFVLFVVVVSFSAVTAQNLTSDSRSTRPPVEHGLPEADNSTIERIETRLVVSAVQVFDKNGVKVTGLRPSDFEVREEGELQDIQSVTYGGSSDTGRSIVLVMDYSSSIVPYMEESLRGAETLIDVLGPNDQMAIVTDDIEVLIDFTSDTQLLRDKIQALRERLLSGTTGKSRQFCALMKTLKELAPHAAQRPIVIFQTDGDQYAMLKGNIGAIATGDSAIRYSFDDLLNLAKSSATKIYTVSPGRFLEDLSKEDRAEIARAENDARKRYVEATSEVRYVKASSSKLSRAFLDTWYRSRSRDQKATIEIAQRTGGWAAGLNDSGDARELYSRILNDGADASYVVAYYPKNESFNGEKRNVSVTLRGNPGYSIRGQKSYSASAKAGY